MEADQSMSFLSLFGQINWLIYGIAVILVYTFGSLWYSQVLFGLKWAKLAHQHSPKSLESDLSISPMVVQFGATAILGLAIFIGVLVSLPLTILFLIAIAGWLNASIFFKHPKLTTFISLALIELGYLLLATIMFFVFAMIS